MSRAAQGAGVRLISTAATWDDLVLPDALKATLREIAAQVRKRRRVRDEASGAKRNTEQPGVTALFVGAQGTAKTLAAAALARDLQLDAYHVELSQVVSTFVGETEQNLNRVFGAAETQGAVLLFDEADALFGKRSEVKDSHDRFANLDVNDLLQRMERYAGLSILATNLRSKVDEAIKRRPRFFVEFPPE